MRSERWSDPCLSRLYLDIEQRLVPRDRKTLRSYVQWIDRNELNEVEQQTYLKSSRALDNNVYADVDVKDIVIDGIAE